MEKTAPIELPFDIEASGGCYALRDILAEPPQYAKVDITIHNVCGWAQYFYAHSSTPKKVQFFKELRNPKTTLAEFIVPWDGEEKDFSLVMDLLNDPYQQKKLGAYYTPPAYARKAVEFVRRAIQMVPEGNDYIILDRCAGTGSLEYELNEEELSHVVINTYELKEWHALKDRLGKRVRYIIPPIPANKLYPNYDSNTGFLSGSDALSERFLHDERIMQYIDNPHCNVILFENPPYTDDSADTPKTGVSRGNSKGSYIAHVMSEKVKPEFRGLVQTKDVANLFIWSGFEYYLKKPEDSYILFSPIKYWKTGHLVDKKLMDGCFFNREHFHAGPSAVSCIWWKNEDAETDATYRESITLPAYDIVNGCLISAPDIFVRKVHHAPSEVLFDKREFQDDTDDGIFSQRNGREGKRGKSTGTRVIYNDNLIGWVHLVGFAFDPKNIDLTRNVLNLRKNGFALRADNFEKKLPLFCAKAFPQNEWWETDVYSTSGDGGTAFEQDIEFLKKCLVWTCLTQKNRCRSLDGSDNRLYRNELCFDGETAATNKISKWSNIGFPLTDEEKSLIESYNKILSEIKRKDPSTGNYIYEEYVEWYAYGTYQIDDEINVSIVVGYDRKGKEKLGPKHGDLNNMLSAFKRKAQAFYNKHIVSDLLKYELLK